jgi:hypothetical protein
MIGYDSIEDIPLSKYIETIMPDDDEEDLELPDDEEEKLGDGGEPY